METKICSECCLEQPNENFKPNRNKCNSCLSAYHKAKYQQNKNSILAKKKLEYDPIKEREKNHTNYSKHRDKRLAQQKEYVEKNKDRTTQYKKQWAQKKKEHLKQYRKEYNKNNKDYIRVRHNNKLKEDPIYALSVQMRKNILKAFRNRGFDKGSSTQLILGCSFEEFKNHIESLWEPWMTWENRGKYNGTPNYGWDIDHVRPLSTGLTLEDIIKLNHYTNLKPLCSYINRDVKKDDINWEAAGYNVN